MCSLRIFAARVTGVVLFWGCWPAIVSGQSDVTPPQLVSLTISPSPVDTTNGPQTVTFTIQATDDLSGLSFGCVSLQSPPFPDGSRQFQNLCVSPLTFGALSGAMTGSLQWPQNTQAGVWAVTDIQLFDAAGNTNDLATYLSQQAFPYSLTVISGIVDSTAPVLSSMTFSPTTVDVSAGPQQVTVNLNITDDLSGVDFTRYCQYLSLIGPVQNQRQPFFCNQTFTRISGTPLSGAWQTTITIPQFSEPGIWQTFLLLADAVGNSAFYNAFSQPSITLPSLTVISAQPDVISPVLTSLSFPQFSPGATPFIDTTVQFQTVNVDLGFTDNLSGELPAQFPGFSLFWVELCFSSPSRQQRNCGFYSPLQSGTPVSGHLLPQVFFPRFSEAGTWDLDLLELADADSNFIDYSASDLANFSMPNKLIVGQTSQLPDNPGQVPPFGPAGGTVMDSVYGAKAQITAPPGVLSGPTTVFIDVLPNPPPVNIPQGYSAAGTLFVDFNLVDQNGAAIHSFLAPGISVIIPLPSSMSPGTSLVLYRLQGGALVPETSVNGGFVIGHVNADTLTASFTGLATLSTVVGLVPAGVPGDANGDGKVDCADVAIIRAVFGKKAGDAGFDPRADINADGVVDITDLVFVLRQLPAGTRCQ